MEPDFYKAVFDLPQSLVGSADLDALLTALAAWLRPIIPVDHLALALPSAARNELRLENSKSSTLFSSDSDPLLESVWREQKPRVLSCVERETSAEAALRAAFEDGIRSLTLVPLSSGDHRLGVLLLGFRQLHESDDRELRFLQRIASELALAVDAQLTRLALQKERERMRVLSEITTTVSSKLPMNELFDAISEQLSRVVKHDRAAINLLDKATGKMHLTALHSSLGNKFEIDEKDKIFSPEGLVTGEAIATGKPVVTSGVDLERFPSPLYRKYAHLFSGPKCSVPLIGKNGVFGTIGMDRQSGEPFTADEVELMVQVSRQIATAIENSLAYRDLTDLKDRLARENLYLEQEIRSDQNFNGIIGESPALQQVLKKIHVVAPTDSTVLVQGETGTGKELIARAIHDLSGRSKQPFIKVNCAAIPPTLLESELFGHEKGSFTGAFAQKIGRFELAHKGTLFLDEIGEIPLELQSKLLRAVQEQELERLGGNRTIHVDVRFVAATNRNLKQMVEEGKFRSDLYYRLNVFPMTVPPLRDRKEDIPILIRYFTQKYAKRMNRMIDKIPPGTIEALTRYDWPGNVRELQNIIERSVILSTERTLQVVLLEPGNGEAPSGMVDRVSGTVERQRILKVLCECGGKVAGPEGAAARLGMRRTTLQSRMKRLNIERAYR